MQAVVVRTTPRSSTEKATGWTDGSEKPYTSEKSTRKTGR